MTRPGMRSSYGRFARAFGLAVALSLVLWLVIVMLWVIL